MHKVFIHASIRNRYLQVISGLYGVTVNIGAIDNF